MHVDGNRRINSKLKCAENAQMVNAAKAVLLLFLLLGAGRLFQRDFGIVEPRPGVCA